MTLAAFKQENKRAVVAATLDVPIECTFANASGMNDLPSYSVPPLPTIRGMLYAAWGRPSLLNQGTGRRRTMEKDHVEAEKAFRNEIEADTSIGIRIIDEPISKRDLRTRKKVSESADPYRYNSTPTTEETLISPTYRIYIAGDPNHCSEIARAFRDPERLLYLGQSGNLVDIQDVTETHLQQHDSEQYLADVIVPNGDGNNPTMLPVSSEQIESRSVRPGEVQYVTQGGTVNTYYTLDQEESVDGPFVLID